MRLNHDQLAEAGGHDPDLTRELIELLITDGQQRVEKICCAYEREEWNVVAREAHCLKGACVNLGAEDLGDFCERVDASVRCNNLTPAPSDIELIRTEFNSLVLCLKETVENYRA